MAESSSNNTTPEQRADILIKQLEKFIREGRTAGLGMSFSTWQNMARGEVADTIREAEQIIQKDYRSDTRTLLLLTFAVITIGFWGMVLLTAKALADLAAVLIGIAMVVIFIAMLDWLARRIMKWASKKRREETLGKVEGFHKKIKRVERELEKRKEKLEEDLEKPA